MFKYVREEMNLIESTLGTRRYQKDQEVKTIGTRETNRIREQKKKKNLEKTTKPSNQMAFCIIKKARKRKNQKPNTNENPKTKHTQTEISPNIIKEW